MSSFNRTTPGDAAFSGSALRRNIEIKARVSSLVDVRAIAGQVATDRLGEVRQIDTYFVCSRGRLKLRETGGRDAQLISYERDDTTLPKASRYRLVPVPDALALKSALAQACGVVAVVDKRREIFLHHNVRIHLDVVVGLGEFLELEAVLQSDADESAGRQQVEELLRLFGIRPSDLASNSYADMTIAAAGP